MYIKHLLSWRGKTRAHEIHVGMSWYQPLEHGGAPVETRNINWGRLMLLTGSIYPPSRNEWDEEAEREL